MSNVDETHVIRENDHNHATPEYLGYGHQDIGDDLAALKSILGISGFSRVRRLKNSLSTIKALFIQ